MLQTNTGARDLVGNFRVRESPGVADHGVPCTLEAVDFRRDERARFHEVADAVGARLPPHAVPRPAVGRRAVVTMPVMRSADWKA